MLRRSHEWLCVLLLACAASAVERGCGKNSSFSKRCVCVFLKCIRLNCVCVCVCVYVHFCSWLYVSTVDGTMLTLDPFSGETLWRYYHSEHLFASTLHYGQVSVCVCVCVTRLLHCCCPGNRGCPTSSMADVTLSLVREERGGGYFAEGQLSVLC